jgi:hypothetical protein
MSDLEVHTCWHLGRTSSGETGHCRTDLIFTNEGPVLVFEWTDLPSGKSVPSVALLVDPARIAELNWPDCRYGLMGGAVDIPDGIARFD